MTRWTLGVLLAAGVVAMAAAARAQDGSSPAGEVAGTAAEFVLALNPYTAQGREALDASRLTFSGNARFCTADCSLQVPFTLPSGAMIAGLAVAGGDENPAGEVTAQLLRCAIADSCTTLGPLVSTGLSDTPGVTEVRDDLTTPHTVDNKRYSYAVFVSLTGGGSTVRLIGLRVYYRLQVSPAPVTATFGDVPASHPFFQFVEALVASGITAGCGGGNYCPDAPLTRGQMAVFLGKALGLHFAP
jgi:hypothetical protein